MSIRGKMDNFQARLRLVELTKYYGDLAAVSDLSLEAEDGEFVTLLGPSGCGKTTTLMIIAGFVNPSSGRIYIDDRDVTFVPPYKRHIGMVFQDYALFPHMMVYENIAFALKVRKFGKRNTKERVASMMELVQLTGLEARYPNQLSGGQQQRVALARALVFEPQLLLLDEPLGALDKQLREYMQLEIKHLTESLGITVIYVTHDQSEALTMSDRIVVMNNGGIEQVGTPGELYENPCNRFVAGFIGESNFLEGRVAVASDQKYIVSLPDGLEVRIPAFSQVKTGDKISLAIRPEKIRFINSDNRPANVFPGVIKELVYIGDDTKYNVEISPNVVLTVKQQNRGDIPEFKRGNRIEIGWAPQDAKKLNP